MITLPDAIVNLLPLRLREAYLRRLVGAVCQLYAEKARLEWMLRDVEPTEYTEGFRGHLWRRLDEAETETARVVGQLSRLDPDRVANETEA